MKITNINSFLTLIEGLNNDIDYLLTEQVWDGVALSGTVSGDSVLGISQETPADLETVKKGLDANFIVDGEARDDTTMYLTDEELKDLLGEDGANTVKELSKTDIKNLLLLQKSPRLKGYILRSGTKAGRIVLRAAIKGGKIAKGIILAGQFNTTLFSKNSKSVGYCFCMGLVKEFEDSPNPSLGTWRGILNNVDESYANGSYEKYQYKELQKSFKKCSDEFDESITKKINRNKEGVQCDTFSDMLGEFDDAMSAIIAGLSKYFSIKDKEGSKQMKSKNSGSILASKEEIRVKFTTDVQLKKTDDTDCINCITTSGGKLGPWGLENVKVEPTGTSGDRTISCKWNKQHGDVDKILMEFDSVVVGRIQDMQVTFFNGSGKMTHKTAVTGKITSMG